MVVIGVTGSSGSGKSLLSHTIKDQLGSSRVVVVSEDCYYKPFDHISDEEKKLINWDHPNAFDHNLLKEHLKKLKKNESIKVPQYNYVTNSREESKGVTIPSKTVILVLEGILIFNDPELRDLMDIKVYMDTPADTSLIRRLQRDISERGRTVDSVINQYQKTVKPMYLRFIQPSKMHADLIVPHGGKNMIAVDLIRAKLKELL